MIKEGCILIASIFILDLPSIGADIEMLGYMPQPAHACEQSGSMLYHEHARLHRCESAASYFGPYINSVSCSSGHVC